ncbi:DUF4446 family protein [Clostridium sp.]|jgi:tetrahydromethanopterin S-methyltransferase subunit G|uniref:DUF4446 family protein n=1 Tax=Clostridium sp. TaxID=1506 RepID=UPI0039F4A783
MKEMLGILEQFQPYIIVSLSIITVILIIAIIVILNSINKLENKYRKLTRGVNNKNLEEVVLSYFDRIDEVEEKTEEIKSQHEELINRLKNCTQKVSMVRYKAFEDIGSDLSFSIAMLNGNNDGIVLTGIYGRDESIVYAKPIDKGISRYELSEEEEEVLLDACNKVN